MKRRYYLGSRVLAYCCTMSRLSKAITVFPEERQLDLFPGRETQWLWLALKETVVLNESACLFVFSSISALWLLAFEPACFFGVFSGLTHQTNITNNKFWADDRIFSWVHTSINERFDLYQVGPLGIRNDLLWRKNSRQLSLSLLFEKHKNWRELNVLTIN